MPDLTVLRPVALMTLLCAALDLNLGGPSLQPPPGLLLDVASHPRSGQKRQRTDDDDPAGIAAAEHHLICASDLPLCSI